MAFIGKKDIPLTYMWLLSKLVGNGQTVLDLGCGDGALTRSIYKKGWEITGVDIYKKSLDQAKKREVYKYLIKGDIEKVVQDLVKRRKKYDVVLFSQVIEHISKKKGERVLDLIEKLAKRRILVGTPNGFMVQPEVFIRGNPHQHHHSGWVVEDFLKRGYKVLGVGVWFIWSETGWGRTQNMLPYFLITIFAYFLAPVAYIFPKIAAGILAIKDKPAAHLK
ncbi:hypothetical protein A3B45_00275 [Candidatus Daviesbacteria bacterium RIFCSPLOWO2_01_FULL_39_12]|uniref:Methyltransferase domain-containing protein n=1 Tax=Candidatus Daviesbacteria bacterium RIFCSPLOWO2_01_FULL_39_12 TaxID=1797785 RepID=A0A1F5KP87_9BACT|nr:MAG: hypothetical protein A3D79_00845 [Candidatus Daviesbacteria bacterium RIFCSPHIGHO2_02_FULL_39_8]OGE42629.1 MAG: hypothetical protein A3B45_00275 [Candidatus Daviesbacteria bacterium RIFCSPLOWO2_01_FULL_39_12]